MSSLAAEHLWKAYGPVKVLKDVSLTLRAGEAHVVIGPNGAGKTTLFRCLSGESRVDAGLIRFEEDDVTRLPDWRRVHRGVGRTFQVASVFTAMTVEENLIVALEARERRSAGPLRRLLPSVAPSRAVRREAQETLNNLDLAARADLSAAALSHGDRKRLELAMSVALRPKLLMLDEPTAGMSPADRSAAVAMLDRVRRTYGLTLLLTEHDMEVVFGLADRLSVLHHGEMIASGAPAEVRANPTVREIYLGHG